MAAELTPIKINVSTDALTLLDAYRTEQRLTRAALIESLLMHLAELQKVAPKVMDAIVRDAGRTQQERTQGRRSSRE